MKTIFQLFVPFLFLVLGNSPQIQAQTVYITKTGEKYHKNTCRYLKYSKIAVTLSEAKDRGYEACLVCKPGREDRAFYFKHELLEGDGSVWVTHYCEGERRANVVQAF